MKLKILFASLLIILKLTLFIYPAIIISLVILDPHLKSSGQSQFVPMWFNTTTYKYNSWAKEYLQTKYATMVKSSNVASTEWPMFGSVFYLLTIEELKSQNKIDITQSHIQEAISNAVTIIASPDTATWVKKKWKKSYLKTGKSYLEKENVFYRMLLIMGLTSYEKITSDSKYHPILEAQVTSLFHELSHAKFHLADDYPDQCYPNDILWAVAAMKKANTLDLVSTDIDKLSVKLLHTLKTAYTNHISLPAFQMNSKTAKVIQNARGSGTSGILQFTPMLDINLSNEWYQTYVQHFWKENTWLVGFREFNKNDFVFTDVDSGPIIFDIGSVASLFGIGASKGTGHLNNTIPLTIETIAFSWPTPYGFLIPSVMGKLTVDSWVLGDIALLFSMTRPNYSPTVIPFDGAIPLSVWGVLFTFIVIGILLIYLEIKWLHYLILTYLSIKRPLFQEGHPMKILYTLPKHSLLNESSQTYDYMDSISIDLNDEDIGSKELLNAFITTTPTWIIFLMKLRNKIVSLFGLKNKVSPLQENYIVGDKIGFFEIYSIKEKEIILGEDDKHLDFRISLLIDDKNFILSTVVIYNNIFGRLYFFVIKFFHKRIIVSMAKEISKALIHKEKIKCHTTT